MRTFKGASLVELVIIVSIVAALAFIAVPRLQFATLYRKQAGTVAKKIVTDLRRTRQLAISDAANNTDGFALNMIGGAPTPIPLPMLAAPIRPRPRRLSYTAYKIVNLNTSTTIANGTFSIDSAITCTGGNEFEFGPLGNLLSGSDTNLRVSAEGKTFTITIIPATGTIKCVEN